MRSSGRIVVVFACVVADAGDRAFHCPRSSDARRRGAGHLRRGAARRHGRGGESVLIEKARTAVTDGTGQYRITELPPGTYTLTSQLSGIQRGEARRRRGDRFRRHPDQRRAARRRAAGNDHGDRRDAGRRHAERAPPDGASAPRSSPRSRHALLWSAADGHPGDDGRQHRQHGAMTAPFMTFFTANGGRANEGRMMIDGLPVAASFNGGGVSTFIYDVANTEEMQVLVSGGLGEAETGGPRSTSCRNRVATRSTVRASTAARAVASGDNLDDTCAARADAACPRCSTSATPTARAAARSSATGSGSTAPRATLAARRCRGRLRQPQRRRPDEVGYARDPNIEVRSANRRDILSFRLTGQLTARNRVSFSHEHQHRCSGSDDHVERRGLPGARRQLGRAREHHHLARDVSRLSRFPVQRDPGDLDVAGVEPPAARGRLFTLPVPVGRLRHRAAGRLDDLIPVTESTTIDGIAGTTAIAACTIRSASPRRTTTRTRTTGVRRSRTSPARTT